LPLWANRDVSSQAPTWDAVWGGESADPFFSICGSSAPDPFPQMALRS